MVLRDASVSKNTCCFTLQTKKIYKKLAVDCKVGVNPHGQSDPKISVFNDFPLWKVKEVTKMM